ncbi:diguanylate cyclase [Bacillus sp. AK128]
MMKSVLKNGTPFVTIISLITLSLYYFSRFSTLPTPTITVLPYILLGLIIMLFGFGYAFNRLKVFYLGLHLFILFLLQNVTLFHTLPGFTDTLFPYVLAANIGIILLVRDGAVLSSQGKIMVTLLIAEVIFLYIFYDEIVRSLSSITFPIQLSIYDIPEIPVLMFLLIFVGSIFNILRSFTNDKVFLLGSVLSIFLGLRYLQEGAGVELFLLSSAVLLLLAVVFRTYSMAYIDELTGIPSRRMLKVDVGKLGSKYSIAMLDIDFFKKFNDKYGHDVGDDVLILVAKGLERVTGGGKAYRYGGEEFTIVFPKKDMDDVLPHLESLREKISKKEYVYKKKNRSGESVTQKLKVTISIGISERQSKTKSPDDVIKQADQALYRAKKKGRNCVST